MMMTMKEFLNEFKWKYFEGETSLRRADPSSSRASFSFQRVFKQHFIQLNLFRNYSSTKIVDFLIFQSLLSKLIIYVNITIVCIKILHQNSCLNQSVAAAALAQSCEQGQALPTSTAFTGIPYPGIIHSSIHQHHHHQDPDIMNIIHPT